MELKREDILGVVTEKNELLCKKCATEQDWAAVDEKAKVFMPAKLKETTSLFFCDKCGTRLKA